MKNYCFLMDTSGNRDIVNIHEDTYVLPFNIIINDGNGPVSYNDWYDITREQVFDALANGYDVSTSQTAYGITYETFENLLKEYERIFCFTITKEFSGTYNTWCSIKKQLEEEYGKDRIYVFDTKALGIMQNQIVKIVKVMLDQGKSVHEIEKAIKKHNNEICGFTCITNASQLVKGGRLKGLKAILVKALNIKLVIKYQDGKLTFTDKSLNLPSAIDKGIEMLSKELNFKKNPPKRVVFMSDLSNEEEVNNLIQYSKMKFANYPDCQFSITESFPIAVISHLGNSSFSILVCLDDEPQ